MEFSLNLLEELSRFTEFYVNHYIVFDEEAFVNHVDKGFPGWTHLLETIKRFHSKFNMVNKYEPSILVNYDESDDETDDEFDVESDDPIVIVLSDESDDEHYNPILPGQPDESDESDYEIY